MNRRIISAATALGVGLALTAGGLAPAVAAPATPTATAPDPTTAERPDDRGPVPEATFPEVGDATYDPDHVLVKFAPSTTGAQQRSALEAVGGSSEGDVDGTPYVQVAVGDEDPVDVVARLDSDPRVAEAQLDHVRHAYGWTDDPLLEWAWPYIDTLRLPRAWDASTGAGVTIAVLDTGVSAHPDLTVLPGIDLVDHDNDASDPHGHGTMVAGIAAATGDNGIGSVGAASDAKILPVRVLDATGGGDDSTIAAGVAWAAGHGAGVINLSLGGTDPSPVLRDAISAAVAAGVVVVAAAGNAGTEQAQYPAAYAPQIAGLLAVSATDDDGSLAAFSSWGDWVSLAAPGDTIIGTYKDGGYAYGSGTSFSAPFVAGAAALVRAHATMTPATVEERLETTARDAGPRGTDPYYGFGVLDAASAVTTADPVPAAVAVPFDRMPGDGLDNDTPATAGPLAPQSVGTIAPEGDVDWYRATIGSAGWYRVEADILVAPTGAQVLDLAVEVRSSTGTVLGTASVAEPAATEKVVFPMTAGGDVLIGISNANPSASDQSYRVMLFAEPGPVTFTSTQYEDPEWASSAAAGDLTGDGIADVVTTDYDEAFFRVQTGNGDGTLDSPVEVAIPAGYGLTVTGLSTADVDGDGDLDVLVTTVNGVGVFTQAGGVLTAHGLIADTGAWDTIPIDADGDGDRDLVITGSPILLALNNGTGTFTVQPGDFGTGDHVDAGFLDGDTHVDIVVDDTLHLDADLGASAGLPAGPDLLRFAIGDVTGDGRADIVNLSFDEVEVIPGRGDGTFDPKVVYPLDRGAWVVRIADMDGDGLQDVVALGDAPTSVGRLTVLRQQAGGTLGVPSGSDLPDIVAFFGHPGIAPADLDGDGDLDVVTSGLYLVVSVQRELSDTEGQAWVRAVTPAPHTTGAAARQVVSVTLDRPLRTPVPSSVRIVDAAGASVAVNRTYNATTKTIQLTPTADLTPGSHYEVIVDGLTDTSGATQSVPVRTWFTVAAHGDRYTPVDPVRVLDTRTGVGTWEAGRVPAGKALEVALFGLPADATAVVLNVTAVNPSAAGNVRVYPEGLGAPPLVSNINVMPGVDQPNLVTVALGPDHHTIRLLPDATTTDLIADIAGYYSPGAATAFEPLTPTRVMDMRDGTGVRKGALKAGQWVDLSVADGSLVPKDATAVVLNVTGTQVTGPTHVRVYPTPGSGEDQTPPDISNLNLLPGRDQPNLVTVKVGDGGRVRFFTPIASELLIADVAGYYTATGDNGFVPISPVRIGDTRFKDGFTGKLIAGTAQDLAVTGHAGVPSNAVAAVLNVTGVHPSLPTHVRAYPTAPGTPPDVSTINLVPGRDDANLALVKLGTGGKVSFFTPVGTTDLVVDVSGYFRR